MAPGSAGFARSRPGGGGVVAPRRDERRARGREPAAPPTAMPRARAGSMTRRVAPRAGDALIIVDLQRDFCPGGALAVPGGDRVIAPINRLAAASAFVVATRDWHPPDHHSFETQGGPWPVHCVRNTPGAELDPRLDRGLVDVIVDKGLAPDLDGYSAFEATKLESLLRARGIARVHVAGLALDYCVKHTALDARRLGFTVVVHRDATRAVNLRPGDDGQALEELLAAGAEIAP